MSNIKTIKNMSIEIAIDYDNQVVNFYTEPAHIFLFEKTFKQLFDAEKFTNLITTF